MRTVKIDQDHVASYEGTGKKCYRIEVRHALTNRDVGACQVHVDGEDVIESVRRAGRAVVRDAASKRLLESTRYALGERVAEAERRGAPAVEAMPPAQREQVASGAGLEIAATLPVKMPIRDAYDRDDRRGTRVETPLSMPSPYRQHEVLIGATDEQILKIARREATLVGSLRAGITYKELS